MKNTPNVPEEVLAQMRSCIYSSIQCASLNLQPDYLCNKGKRQRDCVLYWNAHCRNYEPFPERYDT